MHVSLAKFLPENNPKCRSNQILKQALRKFQPDSLNGRSVSCFVIIMSVELEKFAFSRLHSFSSVCRMDSWVNKSIWAIDWASTIIICGAFFNSICFKLVSLKMGCLKSPAELRARDHFLLAERSLCGYFLASQRGWWDVGSHHA